jgi:hypothetical protein
MPDADVEDLIARLASGLAADDREAFRQAAEAALASSAQCWGPGSIYRTVVPLWRRYFHPPIDEHVTTWGRLESDYGRRRSRSIRTAG